METSDVPPPPLSADALRLEFDDKTPHEGFVAINLSPTDELHHHHQPHHLQRHSPPLYFGVMQAGLKSNKDFVFHLRCTPPPSQPVRVAYRLCRARGASSRDGWAECSLQESSALELVVPPAGQTKKMTSRSADSVKLEQTMSELSLADGVEGIELERDGTKSLRFRLRKRFEGVYCMAFELVGRGRVPVLYGPPMAMVANTGITRADMRQATGDVLRHVFLDYVSAGAAAADASSVTRFINAACESFKQVRPFRDADDAYSAHQHVPDHKRTGIVDLFDQLFAAAWLVVTKISTTATLRGLWAHNPKLIEGYLTHPDKVDDIGDKAKWLLVNQPAGSFMLRLSAATKGVISISFVAPDGVTHSRLNFDASQDTVAEDKKQPYASLRALLLDAESLTHLVALRWSRQGKLEPVPIPKAEAFANDAIDDDNRSSPQQSGKKKSKKADSSSSYGTTSQSREAALERQNELLRRDCEILRSQLQSATNQINYLKLELLLSQPVDNLPDSDHPPVMDEECVVEAHGQAPLPQGVSPLKRPWEGDDEEAEGEGLMDHEGDPPLDIDLEVEFERFLNSQPGWKEDDVGSVEAVPPRNAGEDPLHHQG